jgi:hypothetical protein
LDLGSGVAWCENFTWNKMEFDGIQLIDLAFIKDTFVNLFLLSIQKAPNLIPKSSS